MIQNRHKAVAMLSGGLDSTLALRLILDQGIEVIGVNFSTGFCLTDHAQQVHRKGTDPQKLRNQALRLGADFRIPVEIIDIADEYMGVLKRPKYGYGKNVNPCIDCRILMMTKAKDFMEEVGAAFVFTGEVLGQRPKSQHRRALAIIAHDSGLEDRLVRPLSARLLPPTHPERVGILDRDRLLGLRGRDRNPQLELAARLGITEWPQPAGGCCYLTDPNYAVKVFDLFEHGRKQDLTREDMVLCKVGRHFRVDGGAKVIVGRFEEENAFLENFGGDRPRLEAMGFSGPISLVDGTPSESAILAAARLTARYSDGKRESQVTVQVRHHGTNRLVEVRPYAPEECEAWILR